ncbi:MAG: hypothetical protein KR126chlam2_00228 [Chlamydiae bacterium]|nr:hypothetical protein [Chlamydiota bacterium]
MIGSIIYPCSPKKIPPNNPRKVDEVLAAEKERTRQAKVEVAKERVRLEQANVNWREKGPGQNRKELRLKAKLLRKLAGANGPHKTLKILRQLSQFYNVTDMFGTSNPQRVVSQQEPFGYRESPE